jgi:hypothetical protein
VGLDAKPTNCFLKEMFMNFKEVKTELILAESLKKIMAQEGMLSH